MARLAYRSGGRVGVAEDELVAADTPDWESWPKASLQDYWRRDFTHLEFRALSDEALRRRENWSQRRTRRSGISRTNQRPGAMAQPLGKLIWIMPPGRCWPRACGRVQRQRLNIAA